MHLRAKIKVKINVYNDFVLWKYVKIFPEGKEAKI